MSDLVSADFNHDGLLDLAATNPNTNTVSLQLGSRAGSFGPPFFFQTGTFPSALVAAKLNGDPNLDLAVANNNSGTISVLLGTGSGGFATGPTINLASFPSAITAGDFNGDARTDLVVDSLNGIEVVLASPSGGFGTATFYPAGIRLFSHSLVTDDFNADARLDIAAANPDDAGSVLVFLGDGIGGFGPPAIIPTGVSSWSVASGDFNRDGRRDLAVANRGTTSPLGSSDLAILIGRGDGTFVGPTSFSAGAGAVDIVVGDIDRDGDQDLAVANQFCCLSSDATSAALSILLGDGSGGFAAPWQSPSNPGSSGAFAIVLGDFDQDGNLDVALGDSSARILVYLACTLIPVDIPVVDQLGLVLLALALAVIAVRRLTR